MNAPSRRLRRKYRKIDTEQKRAIAAEPGSNGEVGRRHGFDHSVIRSWRIKYGGPLNYIVKEKSQKTDGNGNVETNWEKSVLAGLGPDELAHLPDPKRITSVSTMTTPNGKRVQWIREEADKAERERLWKVAAEEMARSISYRAPPMPANDQEYAQRCVVVPVGDHHHGLWSSPNEGSGTWDLAQSEQVLADSIDELLASTTASEQCLLTTLGDLFHYDSLTAKTPRHGHVLDASGRYADMVRSGIRMLRRCIDRCLQRHRRVHVIVAAGNHDEASSVFLREAIAVLYEAEPRITVDRSPKSVAYYEYGRNLLGVHHGDLIKPERLPAVMAADQAQAWGRTSFRLWMTGHIHHASRREFPGVHVESFGVLPPRDQYAESHGYRSDRSLTAIVLDPERGEVQRHTVRV